MKQEFKQSILNALANPNLTGALGRFSVAYRVSRAKAYEGIDFEAVRARSPASSRTPPRTLTNSPKPLPETPKLAAPRYSAPTVPKPSRTTF